MGILAKIFNKKNRRKLKYKSYPGDSRNNQPYNRFKFPKALLEPSTAGSLNSSVYDDNAVRVAGDIIEGKSSREDGQSDGLDEVESELSFLSTDGRIFSGDSTKNNFVAISKGYYEEGPGCANQPQGSDSRVRYKPDSNHHRSDTLQLRLSVIQRLQNSNIRPKSAADYQAVLEDVWPERAGLLPGTDDADTRLQAITPPVSIGTDSNNQSISSDSSAFPERNRIPHEGHPTPKIPTDDNVSPRPKQRADKGMRNARPISLYDYKSNSVLRLEYSPAKPMARRTTHYQLSPESSEVLKTEEDVSYDFTGRKGSNESRNTENQQSLTTSQAHSSFTDSRPMRTQNLDNGAKGESLCTKCDEAIKSNENNNNLQNSSNNAPLTPQRLNDDTYNEFQRHSAVAASVPPPLAHNRPHPSYPVEISEEFKPRPRLNSYSYAIPPEVNINSSAEGHYAKSGYIYNNGIMTGIVQQDPAVYANVPKSFDPQHYATQLVYFTAPPQIPHQQLYTVCTTPAPLDQVHHHQTNIYYHDAPFRPDSDVQTNTGETVAKEQPIDLTNSHYNHNSNQRKSDTIRSSASRLENPYRPTAGRKVDESVTASEEPSANPSVHGASITPRTTEVAVVTNPIFHGESHQAPATVSLIPPVSYVRMPFVVNTAEQQSQLRHFSFQPQPQISSCAPVDHFGTAVIDQQGAISHNSQQPIVVPTQQDRSTHLAVNGRGQEAQGGAIPRQIPAGPFILAPNAGAQHPHLYALNPGTVQPTRPDIYQVFTLAQSPLSYPFKIHHPDVPTSAFRAGINK